MSQGFYEMLGVDPQATEAQIRAAYQDRLAALVRRLRGARRQGADVSILEGQERSLREAVEVLTDAARRRRYDAYLAAGRKGLPNGAEELWEAARSAEVDPVGAAAVMVVDALTGLRVSKPFGDLRPPAGPAPAQSPPPVRMAPPKAAAAPPPAPTPTAGGVPLPEVEDLPTAVTEVGPPAPQPAHDQPTGGIGLSVPGDPELDFGVSEVQYDTPVVPPPPARPVDPVAALADAHGFSGAFLRGVRELRGVDLEALADKTRISLRYLKALEDDAYDHLPAATFVRGYVKQLVKVLELDQPGEDGGFTDGSDVVAGYMALFEHHRG